MTTAEIVAPLNKLNTRQIAQLGGFAAAKKAGATGMALKGSRGGAVTAERHGREHFIRAAHKRWGRLQNTHEAGRQNGDSGIESPPRKGGARRGNTRRSGT